MKTARTRRNLPVLLIAAIAVLAVVTAFSRQADAAAEIKYVCSNDVNVRCLVTPYAVTRTSNDKGNKVTKSGHMIERFYQCFDGVCINYMSDPEKKLPYSCSLDDFDCFCKVVKPNDCKTGNWVKKP